MRRLHANYYYAVMPRIKRRNHRSQHIPCRQTSMESTSCFSSPGSNAASSPRTRKRVRKMECDEERTPVRDMDLNVDVPGHLSIEQIKVFIPSRALAPASALRREKRTRNTRTLLTQPPPELPRDGLPVSGHCTSLVPQTAVRRSRRIAGSGRYWFHFEDRIERRYSGYSRARPVRLKSRQRHRVQISDIRFRTHPAITAPT